MLTEKSIKFECGLYWVCEVDNQYTVYKQGLTHSLADSSYAHTEDGVSISINGLTTDLTFDRNIDKLGKSRSILR